MDIDVEPLESQAYQRSKEAALQQALSRTSPSPASSSSKSESRDQHPLKRQKSNRGSKSSIHTPTSRPNLARRRSSGATQLMDHSYPRSGSQDGATPDPLSTSSRDLESRDSQVRYTPVTGRISKAKKGQPVHVCNQCDEPKVFRAYVIPKPLKKLILTTHQIFSRAEHLRRHQLSHQQPRYSCEDCEKTFHRPDLLARHMNRQ